MVSCLIPLSLCIWLWIYTHNIECCVCDLRRAHQVNMNAMSSQGGAANLCNLDVSNLTLPKQTHRPTCTVTACDIFDQYAEMLTPCPKSLTFEPSISLLVFLIGDSMHEAHRPSTSFVFCAGT